MSDPSNEQTGGFTTFGTDLNGIVIELNGNSIEHSVNFLLPESDLGALIHESSEKELKMKAEGMIMVYGPSGTPMAYLNLIHAQHFYPLSILDLGKALQGWITGEQESMPILSLDSHDYNHCDFNCVDCLAPETVKFFQKELNFHSMDIDVYKKILAEVARYSGERGAESVRFEMSGEGNPDMYKHRAEIISFAHGEHNMGCVYISSGSRLTEGSIDALAKHGKYIRISMPGLGNEAYTKYSRQKGKVDNRFTFDDSLRLIETLANKAAQNGRSDELLIGARTCMRPENEGLYHETAKRLHDAGADSFQVVKILVPTGHDVSEYPISEESASEIRDLPEFKFNGDLLHLQVPPKLDFIYYGREFDEKSKPDQCFSSQIAPILYGPHLVMCTHYEKMLDMARSHYGEMKGTPGELEHMMNGKTAKVMRASVPGRCSGCCSIFDNLTMAAIKSHLVLSHDPKDIKFYLTYSK
ncbi:MAG: radical SAM protein [archaeon]